MDRLLNSMSVDYIPVLDPLPILSVPEIQIDIEYFRKRLYEVLRIPSDYLVIDSLGKPEEPPWVEF